MNCTKCGSPIPENIKFCPVCGQAVANQPASAPQPAPAAQPKESWAIPENNNANAGANNKKAKPVSDKKAAKAAEKAAAEAKKQAEKAAAEAEKQRIKAEKQAAKEVKRQARKKALKHAGIGAIIGIVLVAAAVVALVVTGVFKIGKQKVEGKGFDTPEEAIEFYLEGLKEGDLDKMMSAFAVETYAKNYDLATQLDTFSSFLPNGTGMPNLPNDSKLAKQLILENRKGIIARQIESQYISLIGFYNEVEPGDLVTIGDGADYKTGKKFISKAFANSEDFPDPKMEFGDINPASKYDTMFSRSKSVSNFEKQKESSDGIEIDWFGVEITSFDETYLATFQCIKYGNHWYIERLGGPLAVALSYPSNINTLPTSYEY